MPMSLPRTSGSRRHDRMVPGRYRLSKGDDTVWLSTRIPRGQKEALKRCAQKQAMRGTAELVRWLIRRYLIECKELKAIS